MYLSNPLALPINSNPAMMLPPRKFTTILDVARFAARLVDASLDYKSMLDNQALPTERATSREPGQPLCMSQYYRLLGSCRIPGKSVDTQHVSLRGKGNSSSEHIVVICRKQFYCVAVKAEDRGRLNEEELCSQLLHILDDAPCRSDCVPVGLFTGWKRSSWAEVRTNLRNDVRNRRNMELIETALLVICLDEPLPTSFNCRLQRGGRGVCAGNRDETNLILQMLHGGGSDYNSGNRWFDKTLQVIISGDGACGICYEHSPAEGVAMSQMIETMVKQVDSLPATSDVPAQTSAHLPTPERLEWNLEQNELKKLDEAKLFLDNLIKDLDLCVFRYAGYGKEFMKSCKVSPDVYIQLALQLTYYRLYGKLAATYESASTRRFLKGRVDCIRAASPETLEWATSMVQPRDNDVGNKKVSFHLVPDEVKFQLWDDAVRQQTAEMVDNILGQGIDIHLLGLREAARETSPTAAHPLPDIFNDHSYRLANTFLLSTSQVATFGDTFTGYGPVDPNGYGACYNPKTNSIIFCISAFWSSEATGTTKFVQTLEESLNSMQNLMVKRM